MDIDETTRINLLYNFYHSLLTKKQSRYMDLYYVEDFSLSEISEQLDVSRQAVLDNLHRSVSLLESFEKELGLVEKTQEIDDISKSLSQLVQTKYADDKELLALVQRISKINEM
ncbi:YlxM family DNA-binding protein [Companilactobacillus farciminis]|uniref:YlxM family DNA-binding protein n=1 Tax=Companilactobacillus farciminis TaxID=1612 RepID=UPI00233067A8|nr:YlxM family DNA-binding protein [Companilactobacillus farciminis]WCG36537.1 YlxM family DNA-binding protein [Companilactobacillus farciminis]